MIILYENDAVANVVGLGDIRKQLSLCKRKREEDGESRHICAAIPMGKSQDSFQELLVFFYLGSGAVTQGRSSDIHSKRLYSL